MADPAVAERVMSQYPDLRGLLGIPEVGDLLIRAVDPNQPFTQAAFEETLHNTNWWQTTSAAQRQAIMQSAIDPATYYAGTQDTHSKLLLWANNLGVAMDDNTRAWITAAQQSRGLDVDSPSEQLILRQWLHQHPESILPGGRLDALTRTIYATARNDYFTRLDWNQAQGWAMGIALGETDEATMRNTLQQQAAALYPQLGDWLMQGQTPADIINPLRQIAADELEVDINQIDIGTPQWSFLTGVQNEDRNTPYRLPTASEIQQAARKQDVWWQTSKGRQTDAGLTRTLLEAFGKAKY